jgi:adenylate cyclase
MLRFYRKLVGGGFPLRATLITAVITASILTITAICLPIYFSFQKSTNFLWEELGKNIAQRTSEYMTEEFGKASDVIQPIIELFSMGDLRIDSSTDVIDVCYNGLKNNPNFSWFFFARVDGSFYGALKDPKTGEITGITEIPESPSPSGQRLTHSTKYHLNEHNVWEKGVEEQNDFDPRLRPWWQTGINHPAGAWSEPYVSYDDPKEILFTYSQAQWQQGKILGLWAIDYQIDFLSSFLHEITKGEGVRILIVIENGTIIADSDLQNGLVLKSIRDENLPGKMLKSLSQEIQKNPQIEGSFLFKNFYTYIEQLSPSTGMQWKVLTIIDKKHFFAPIYQAVILAILFAAPLSLLFIFLTAVFFGRISKRLKEITFEMEQVRSLKISPKQFASKQSFVREVNIMNKAIDHMRIALSSFAKYVPKDLILDLIKSGESACLGGKKKRMTLLFADLTNFTRLAEELPTDEVMIILGDYLKEMSSVVQTHQGIVDKYIGDSIFAFWGAPESVESHALAACRAALAMQESFQLLWPTLPATYKILLRQRIGINTGRVFVGNIGSAERFDYTAIGNAVNLASRIEGLNRLYQTTILIGEETAQIVKKEMIIRPIDWVAVRGKIQATLIYELVDLRENADEMTIEAIAFYETGLEKYRNREFLAALEDFKVANTLFGGHDTPCKILSERCLSYQSSPPPPGWEGTVYLDEKY